MYINNIDNLNHLNIAQIQAELWVMTAKWKQIYIFIKKEEIYSYK